MTHAIAERVQMENLNHLVPTPMAKGEEEAEAEKSEYFVPTPNGADTKGAEEGNEGTQGKETLQENAKGKEEDELLRSLAITRSKILLM